MIKLSFPTIKLGKYIKKVTTKVKNTDLSQDDLVVYGVTNTQGITLTNNKASDDLGEYIVLSENQFAYNPYRINVGSIGLASEGVFGVVSPAYVVFETTDEISDEFLLYYLKSQLGLNIIKWYGDRGGVRSALRFNDLKKIDFPDIELQQQLLILKKVKKLDNMIRQFNYKLSSEHITFLRKSILQQAVEGKLCEQNPTDEPASVLLEKIKNEKEMLIIQKKSKKQKVQQKSITEEEQPYNLPKGWEWCRLGEVTTLITSGSRDWAKYYSTTGAKFIRMGNLSRGSYSLRMDSIQYVSPPKDGEGNRTRLEADDMLLSITGEVGLLGLIPHDFGEAYINQHTALLRFSQPFIIKYYAYIMLSNLCQKQFNAPQRGIKNSFRLSDIESITIPLPPLAEQQRIVEKLDKLMVLCDELEKEVIDAKEYASQLMEAVLQQAFIVKKENQKDNIIEFSHTSQSNKQLMLAAARGNMRKDTWQRISNEAIKIANEES